MSFTQLPNHKNWSAKRKNRARNGASALGDLQNFIAGSPIIPFLGLVVLFLAFGIVGALESR